MCGFSAQAPLDLQMETESWELQHSPRENFLRVSFSSCLFMIDMVSLLINSRLTMAPGVREDECVGLGNLLCSCLGETVIYGREGPSPGQPQT